MTRELLELELGKDFTYANYREMMFKYHGQVTPMSKYEHSQVVQAWRTTRPDLFQ